MCNTEIKKTITVMKNMRSENTLRSCAENSKRIFSEISVREQDFMTNLRNLGHTDYTKGKMLWRYNLLCTNPFLNKE